MIAKIKNSIFFAFQIYFYYLSLVFGVYSLCCNDWVVTKSHTIGLFQTCVNTHGFKECRQFPFNQDRNS